MVAFGSIERGVHPIDFGAQGFDVENDMLVCTSFKYAARFTNLKSMAIYQTFKGMKSAGIGYPEDVMPKVILKILSRGTKGSLWVVEKEKQDDGPVFYSAKKIEDSKIKSLCTRRIIGKGKVSGVKGGIIYNYYEWMP